MFGLSMQTIYLLVPLSCLAGAVLAGLLGRPLGRRGAHTVTILGVAVFIFLWSLLFQLNEAIALYFAITGAIFAGGSGAVIIGGLYTRWGKTRGAWGALLTGATINLGGVILKQVAKEETVREIGGVLEWFYDLDGQLDRPTTTRAPLRPM